MTPTQIAEVAFAFADNEQIAGVGSKLDARGVVRTLSTGSVDAATDPRRDVYLRLGPLLDVYTTHDVILVATHESRQTDRILTNDERIQTFDGDAVVWG